MKVNNSGTLIGRLARDPEQRGGGAVTTFTLAVDGWNGKTKEKETDFIRCTAFGKLGDTIFNYSKKGKLLGVATRLKPRSWEDPTSGEKRSELSVIVEDVFLGPDPSGAPRPQQRNSAPPDDWGDGPFDPTDPDEDPLGLV